MEYKDYYATLGVSRQSSQDEIQKAYRKLARKYHPDVNRGPSAEDKFKEITESYEVLKDSEKRRTYDRFGKDWKSFAGGRGAPPPGFDNVRFDFGGGGSGRSSFFDALFGGAGGGSRFRGGGSPFGAGDPFGGGGFAGGAGGFNARGQDHEAGLLLTLEEAARGGGREVSLVDSATGAVKTYSINLPRGVRPGQKIRLAGRGGAGVGNGPAGHLFLKIELKPNDRFRLQGFDLYTDLQVSPWAAALGSDAAVATLDGTVKVKIPAGSSTGRKIRLRGRGFPRRGTSGTAGDLYAEIKIVVPEQLSEKERELFEELAKVSSFEPR